jgi:lambda family phage portal protein
VSALARLRAAWWALRGAAPVPRIRNEAAHQAAGTGRRAHAWFAPQLGPNDAVLFDARTLRNRARAGVRNDGYARTAIDRLVSNIIGAGMTPESKAPDAAVRASLHQLWLDWTDESDADGIFDFYGQQAQAVRAWLEGGEVFVRLRDRLPADGLIVPLQLQLLEPELVPLDYTVASGPRRVRAGIELDAIGRRTAYWMYRARPAEGLDIDASMIVRVPAENVIHLYEPLRPGQLRGTPTLTQALVRLYEIDAYDDATIVRQKVAALFAGFITHTAVPGEEDVDPLTGQAITRDEQGMALMGLEPGLMQELRAGEGVSFADPPDATGYGDFMRSALMGAAVAADVPYEVLTGDLRNVNDRTVRVILNEFRRRVEQRQHHIIAFQLCRRVWEAWFDRALLSGALPMPPGYENDPRPWRRVEWVPAAWPYLNPVQDIEAYKASIRSGVMTLGEAVKEIRGRSLEEVLAERKQELELLDALGIVTDSDPRQVSNAGLTQARPDGTVLPDVTNRLAALEAARAPAPAAPSINVTVDGVDVRRRVVRKTPVRDARGLIEAVIEEEVEP